MMSVASARKGAAPKMEDVVGGSSVKKVGSSKARLCKDRAWGGMGQDGWDGVRWMGRGMGRDGAPLVWLGGRDGAGGAPLAWLGGRGGREGAPLAWLK